MLSCYHRIVLCVKHSSILGLLVSGNKQHSASFQQKFQQFNKIKKNSKTIMPCVRKSRIGARPSSVVGAANKSQARRTSGGSARSLPLSAAAASLRNLGKVYSETPWISSLVNSLRLPQPLVKLARRNVISHQQQQGTLNCCGFYCHIWH